MDNLFQQQAESKELTSFHDSVNHIRGQVDNLGQWQGNISFYENENQLHPYKIAKYEDGTLHGRTLTFEPNETGIYRVSTGVTYFKGDIVDSELYLNGKLLESYENEVAGRKQGILWKFNQEGGPIERGFYANGKKEGVITNFYPSGSVKSEKDYSNDVAHGIEQQFDEHGRRTLYKEWERGKQNGSQIHEEFRDGYGLIEFHSTFVDGVETGPYKITSYETVVESGNLVNGKRQGTVNTFEGEILTSRITYRDNVIHGPAQIFSTDHMEQGNYINGKKEGKWELVNLHLNKVFMHKIFEADKALRYARISKDGSVQKEGVYKNGIPVILNPKSKNAQSQYIGTITENKGIKY